MLEKTCIHAVSVRDVFYLCKPGVVIRILIQVNTSAQNVATVVTLVHTWQYTGKVILEINHLNVVFVANDLRTPVALKCTAEFTVERNRLSVLFVINNLYGQITLKYTAEFTVERDRSNVLYVTNDLHGHVTSKYTAELTVERNRLSVVFVENDL